MASVQHLLCSAYKVPFQIRKQFGINESDIIKKQWATVMMQKIWRGYAARKYMKMLNAKATMIQKYVKGWIVRYHLPEIIEKTLEERKIKYYNDMASKIQAWWKGTMVRKYKSNAKLMIETNRKVSRVNSEMMDKIRQLHQQNITQKSMGDEINEEELEKMEEEAKYNVLYELYKMHHLLRTQEIEGIYSNHGTTKLSYIEVLLSSIRLTDYMKAVHEEYYKRKKVEKDVKNIFRNKFGSNGSTENKRLKKLEDLYRLRDTSNDKKEDKLKIPDFIQEKPFNLHTTLSRDVKHIKSIINEEPYKRKIDILKRTFDKTKNMSKHDFNLHVRQHFKPKLDPPPYYIDFWDAGECPIHHCTQIFH